MIKIGDTVRFLNAVGGGVVTRIDKNKGLVFVEDADGFEVPVMERECVVVPKVNEKTNFPVREPLASKAPQPSSNVRAEIVEGKSRQQMIVPDEPVVETATGDQLKVLLAFFANDLKKLQTSDYECYLVNDSNYFLFYNLVNGENGVYKSVASGLIEPNMQELMTDVKKEDLNAWEDIKVQIIAFKQGKAYQPQKTLDVHLKMNAVKFYKLHSFTENEYFDEQAMLVDVTVEQERGQLSDISPDEIKKAMFHKQIEVKPKLQKKIDKPGIIEVDLHINELVDDLTGMINADMLQMQMDKFHAVLAENKNKKGQKIVFIHGKGEGVLRKEIEKQLKTRYKTYYFQDASFREYGFGATMVTIK